ncbi:MAG: glutaminase A [Firmicutes bacterium]|nr:glutaminase A [Bacillota bacterium]
MQCISEDMSAFMAEVVKEEQQKKHKGDTATTMDVVDLEDKELFGIAAVGTDGRVEQGAEAGAKFPLESVSKALGLALALEDVGADYLFKHVACEPRGDQFNSVAAIEQGENGLPSNPMINAGAIVCTAHIKGKNGDERFERLLQFVRDLADNQDIDYNQKMVEEEEKDVNRSIFYYLRGQGLVVGREEDKLVPYFKQTSIEVTCLDLARIAAVFANAGRCLKTGKALISEETVRIVLTLMFTTGMYEGSGRFAVDVGIPAKSGISGAIMAVVPGRMGISTIGPALDAHGNSIAGVNMLKKVARRWHLGAFDMQNVINTANKYQRKK